MYKHNDWIEKWPLKTVILGVLSNTDKFWWEYASWYADQEHAYKY